MPLHTDRDLDTAMSFDLPDNMPMLSLSIPTERRAMGNIELNEELLHHWLKRLPSNDPVEFTARYLDALKRLNSNEVGEVVRMKLLDIYRGPFNDVVTGLTLSKLQRLVSDTSKRQKLIQDMNQVLVELANGYKIVVVEADAKGDNLKLKPLIHMAIYRAIEQLSFQTLHAYKFYRTMPERVFREVHQLYMLMEGSDIADKPVFVNNQYKADFSVKQRYAQLMLTSICNPYGLGDGEVLRTYQLMLQLAPAARILQLPARAHPESGHFYINCLSDRTPAPTVLPVMENHNRPPTLILDTKPILNRVASLFEQADQQGDNHPAADNIRLLRKLVPFLNTSYQRKQPRLPVEGSKQTYIVVGLEHIHRAVTEPTALPIVNHPWLDSPWEVLNKNSYGYLVQKRKVRLAHDLKIGDFVGIIDTDNSKPTLKLASLRWVRTDDFEQSKLGLKFMHGDPIPVTFSIGEGTERYPAFLIRENGLYQQPAMLITQNGIHAKASTLIIKTGKKRFNFTVRPHKLLAQNSSFESFTFKDVLE